MARVGGVGSVGRVGGVGKCACLFLLVANVAAHAQTARIGDVAWMQGCWEMTAGDRVVEEQWTAPRAGTMLGVGRTTRGSTLVEHEFIFLSERDGLLAYEAHPSGQAAVFLSKPISGQAVAFENLGHDFPQRVGYTASGSDGLLGWIEGTTGGRTRRVEFPYRRAACNAR